MLRYFDILVPDFVEIFRSKGKHKLSVILGGEWGRDPWSDWKERVVDH
jgi:hypothetical protein